MSYDELNRESFFMSNTKTYLTEDETSLSFTRLRKYCGFFFSFFFFYGAVVAEIATHARNFSREKKYETKRITWVRFPPSTPKALKKLITGCGSRMTKNLRFPTDSCSPSPPPTAASIDLFFSFTSPPFHLRLIPDNNFVINFKFHRMPKNF